MSHTDVAADQRKRVFAWAMWDPGTQPFASVITTFVFAVYIVGDAFGPKDSTVTALSWTMSLAGLAIALLAPVVGQWAGRRGRQVTALKWLTWGLVVMSGLLFFVKPHPSYLVFGLVLLGVGTIVSDVGSSLYNGMLDDVAQSGKVGQISGFGWGMGYLGGIIALLVIYVAWIKPTVGWLGVTSHDGMNIRVSMLFCAVWILVLTLPTFLILHDTPRRADESETKLRGFRALGHAYAQLWRSVVRIWHVSRNTIIFLIASAFFRDGLNGVFQFGGPIARQTFGFSASDVLVFGIVANLVAGISTMLLGRIDDRIGPKRLIIFSLIVLSACGIGVFIGHNGSAMVFWVLGLVMCGFVGPAQSASRSLLTQICPPGYQGEVFGLYATTGKAVSFLAPALFGFFVTAGHNVTGGDNNQYWGIMGIVVVLLVGLAAMIPVNTAEIHSQAHAD
ncbi:MFS transporter [Cutibacterium sp. WCA-380-WT-3A]|uniref:MFS transporter n=1 Tax=Cutibacterium porci TaxID=2605781 RepID=A0A7K0J6M5_9ACTN|nr:MFS transporter [Cutibacterium porci]MSS45610.1 MFS transporter [Cutibacterium porci]